MSTMYEAKAGVPMFPTMSSIIPGKSCHQVCATPSRSAAGIVAAVVQITIFRRLKRSAMIPLGSVTAIRISPCTPISKPICEGVAPSDST